MLQLANPTALVFKRACEERVAVQGMREAVLNGSKGRRHCHGG